MNAAEARDLLELDRKNGWLGALIESICRARLKTGDAAIDGGSGRGRHALAMAEAVGPAGLVNAFEAAPPLVEQLRTRIGALPQVRVRARALARRSEPASFHWLPAAPESSGLRRPDDRSAAGAIQEIEVETLAIDDLPAADLGRLRLINLSLNGGELDALVGGRRRIDERRPLILLENDGARSARRYRYAITEWFGLFDSLGYAVFDPAGRPLIRAEWDAGGPMRCAAVALGSDDEGFVRKLLPGLMKAEVERARREAPAPSSIAPAPVSPAMIADRLAPRAEEAPGASAAMDTPAPGPHASPSASRRRRRAAPSPRLGVIGSGITRDALSIAPDEHKVAFTFDPLSLLTQAAPSVSFDAGAIEAATRPELPIIRREFGKTFYEELDLALCDLLVVDLFNERWDLLGIEGGVILAMEPFLKSGALKDRSFEIVDRSRPDLDERYEAALARFSVFVRERFDPARIVLHRVNLAESWRDAQGVLRPLPETAIAYARRIHPIVSRCEDQFLAALPEAHAIRVEGQVHSDPGHRWGLAIGHYSPDYYTRFLAGLEAAADAVS